MSKLIRVRDTRTGHTVTITESRLGDYHEIVEEPAVDANGRPRGPVYAPAVVEPDTAPVDVVEEPKPVPPKPAAPAPKTPTPTPAAVSKEK